MKFTLIIAITMSLITVDLHATIKDEYNKIYNKLKHAIDSKEIPNLKKDDKNDKLQTKSTKKFIKKAKKKKDTDKEINDYIMSHFVYEDDGGDIYITESKKYYIVGGYSTSEDSGISSTESMLTAQKKAMHNGFAIILDNKGISSEYFTKEDIEKIFAKGVAENENYGVTKYTARYDLYYDKDALNNTISQKIKMLMRLGYDERGDNMRDIFGYFTIHNKQEWYVFEKAIKSIESLNYNIIGISKAKALIKISSKNKETNIVDDLKNAKIKADLYDDKFIFSFYES
jgi:hypothetical protein